MAESEIIAYIKKQQKHGIPNQAIEDVLKEVGWTDEQIHEGFKQIGNVVSTTSSTKLLGPIELLKKAWPLFAARWQKYISFSVITVFLGIVLGLLAEIIPPPYILHPVVVVGLKTVLTILEGLVSLFAVAVLYLYVSRRHEKKTLSDAIHTTFEKVRAIVWTSGLGTAIVVAGGFLFVVPGLIFSIWFMFALYVVVDSHASGMHALQMSREYVRGRALEVWASTIAFGLILLLFGFIFYFAVYFVLGLVGFASVIDSPIGTIIEAIVSGAYQLIALPLGVIYTYLLFDNVKVLRGEIELPKKNDARLGFYLLAVVGVLLTLWILWMLVNYPMNAYRHNAQWGSNSDIHSYYEEKGIHTSPIP